MNSLDAGLKCSDCIDEGLKKVLVAEDPEPVQLAVNGARTAVTIRHGRALCVKHLHEQIVYSALEGLKTR
jgi:hypothetical protein